MFNFWKILMKHKGIDRKRYHKMRPQIITRMHSSRMRTVHCSGHLGGGGLPRWVSAWGGVSAQGDLLLWTEFLSGGGCLTGGGSAWGCLPGGVHLPLLWTEFLTHACENITFPQLRLRTVTNGRNIHWI